MSAIILALDTSTEACSASLLMNGEIRSLSTLSQRDHAKQMLPMIDQLLADANCALSQIDAIAFGQGPGSFTGIRVGVSMAQGLGFALNKPLIALSTLEILAEGAYRLTGATQVMSAIDARMKEVYLGAYQRHSAGDWTLCAPACVIAPENVAHYLQEQAIHAEDFVAAGTGWQTYPDLALQVAPSTCYLPQSEDMIPLAQQALRRGDLISAEQAEPLYLRDNVTWKKLDGR